MRCAYCFRCSPEGCRLPIYVVYERVGPATSNPYYLAYAAGGSECTDPLDLVDTLARVRARVCRRVRAGAHTCVGGRRSLARARELVGASASVRTHVRARARVCRVRSGWWRACAHMCARARASVDSSASCREWLVACTQMCARTFGKCQNLTLLKSPKKFRKSVKNDPQYAP